MLPRPPRLTTWPWVDTLVVSSGGVGTSFLMRFLSRFRKLNGLHNEEGTKHAFNHPIGWQKCKCVYIFGSPVDAALSLFRRAYHSAHSRRIVEELGVPIEPIAQETTLAQYCEQQVDRFFFGHHFHSWIESPPPYPLLMLRYEAIWDHLNDLADFLELPRQALDEFPKRRARNPYGTATERRLLQQLYADEVEMIGNYSDCRVRDAHSTWRREKLRYLQAVGTSPRLAQQFVKWQVSRLVRPKSR